MTAPFISDRIIDQFCERAGFSHNTVKTYKPILLKYKAFLESYYFEGESFIHGVITSINDFLDAYDDKSYNTFLLALRCLRSYFRWCYRNDIGGIDREIQIDRRWNPSRDHQFSQDLKRIQRRDQIFTDKEIRELLAHLRETSARDYIAVLLMYNYGFRVSELLGIQLKHIQNIQDNWYIWLDGKVGKRTKIGRLVQIDDAVMKEITIYIEDYKIKSEDAYLYFRRRRLSPHWSKDLNGPVSPIIFNRNLSNVCQQLFGRHHTSHNFRHSRITNLMKKGMSEYDIAKQIGLTSLTTLKNHYDHSIRNNEAELVY